MCIFSYVLISTYPHLKWLIPATLPVWWLARDLWRVLCKYWRTMPGSQYMSLEALTAALGNRVPSQENHHQEFPHGPQGMNMPLSWWCGGPLQTPLLKITHPYNHKGPRPKKLPQPYRHQTEAVNAVGKGRWTWNSNSVLFKILFSKAFEMSYFSQFQVAIAL